MKKLLIAGVALVAVLALTGCGANSYTSDRFKAKEKAQDSAASLFEDASGMQVTAANASQYSIGVLGTEASRYNINIENMLGSGYTNDRLKEIGLAVAIANDLSFAVLVVMLQVEGYEESKFDFVSVGTITGSATTFSFTAAEVVNGQPSGATILVSGVKVGAGLMLTASVSGGMPFAQSTSLIMDVDNK